MFLSSLRGVFQRRGVFAAKSWDRSARRMKLRRNCSVFFSDAWTTGVIGIGTLVSSMAVGVSSVCCDAYAEPVETTQDWYAGWSNPEWVSNVVAQPFALLCDAGVRLVKHFEGERTAITLDLGPTGEIEILFPPREWFYKEDFCLAEKIWEDIRDKAYLKIATMKSGVCMDNHFPLLVWELRIELEDGSTQDISGILNSSDSTYFLLKKLRKLIGEEESLIDYFPDFKVALLPIKHPKGKILNRKEHRHLVQSTVGWNGSTVCLMGHTGCGKSSLSNIALGFESKKGPCTVALSADSQTRTPALIAGLVQCSGKNCLVNVMDTPGFYDTETSNEIMIDRIIEFIQQIQNGPNLIAMCVDVQNSRFTKQDKESLVLLHKIFGDELFDHFVVVFTKCDTVKDEDKVQFISNLQRQYEEKISTMFELEKPPKFFATSMDNPKSVASLISYAESRPAFDSNNCRRLADLKRETLEEELRVQLGLIREQVKQLTELLKMKEKENQQLKMALRTPVNHWGLV